MFLMSTVLNYELIGAKRHSLNRFFISSASNHGIIMWEREGEGGDVTCKRSTKKASKQPAKKGNFVFNVNSHKTAARQSWTCRLRAQMFGAMKHLMEANRLMKSIPLRGMRTNCLHSRTQKTQTNFEAKNVSKKKKVFQFSQLIRNRRKTNLISHSKRQRSWRKVQRKVFCWPTNTTRIFIGEGNLDSGAQ